MLGVEAVLDERRVSVRACQLVHACRFFVASSAAAVAGSTKGFGSQISRCVIGTKPNVRPVRGCLGAPPRCIVRSISMREIEPSLRGCMCRGGEMGVSDVC